MFNKKVAMVLSYFVAILLLAEVILMLVMFVWSSVGTAPDLQGAEKYLNLLQQLGTLCFFYLLVTAARYFICCHPEKSTTPKKKVASKN